jgi:cystathionine gamma-synthase
LVAGSRRRGIASTAIHEGENTEFIIQPIYQSAIFKHPFGSTIRGRELKYSREDNPTVNLLERKMQALEGAEDCLAFSSGMAAISTLFLGTLEKGDEIVTSKEIYGASLVLLRSLEKFGLKVKSVLNGEILKAISKETKIVFVESITNPILSVPDIPAIVEKSKERGAIMVVDNTFATPVNFKPIAAGADLVIESATKYLGGHNDVIGGILAGPNELISRLWEWRRNLGGSLDPFAAYLIIRGLKTLRLRVAEHNKSAQFIAEWLEKQPSIGRVHYPGIKSNPWHKRASGLMKGFGGVVSFEVESGERAMRLLKSLNFIKTAPSLGGAETLITHPASSSHKGIRPEERRELGIADGLLRLSVGLEEPEDILVDLEEALKKSLG